MSEQDITDQPLPTSAPVAPLGGEAAVAVKPDAQPQKADAPVAAALTLEELSKTLGKEFPTKEAALKSIQDTYSYIGKKTEMNDDELKAKGYMTRSDFENEMFFKDNPTHASNKEVLEAIAKSRNITIKEAAALDSYKSLYEKAVGFDKAESLKSVVESNPRLASAQTRAKTVADLVKSGSKEAASIEAAKAVREAFDIK